MAPPHRKLWLDWQRGVAVLFMVEVHVLDAWLRPGEGRGWAFTALQMMGGFAAPGFLYMAGLSQALADAAQARKGVPAEERFTGALRRAFWLLGVAYAFRLLEYLLGYAPAFWHLWWDSIAYGAADVLKVDVLNVIAAGLILGALLQVGRPRPWGAWITGLAALAVAFATPSVAALPHAPSRAWDWLYIQTPDLGLRGNFHLFPWVAFLLAGAALAPLAAGKNRPLAWLGITAALFGLGFALDKAWPTTGEAFWRPSTAWFLMRLGVCTGLSGLLQLLPDLLERPLGWLTLLGRQSLVGYIASVELTYGFIATPIKKSLSFGATVAAMVAMIAVTWALSLGWERWQARRKARAEARGSLSPAS